MKVWKWRVDESQGTDAQPQCQIVTLSEDSWNAPHATDDGRKCCYEEN